MNAYALWVDLRERGFRLSAASSGALVVDYPQGCLDDRTRRQIMQYKTALLVLLAANTDGPSPSNSTAAVSLPATETNPSATGSPLQTSMPMPGRLRELTLIRTWLASIGETNEAIVEEVLTRCERHPDALRYFLGRSGEITAGRSGVVDDRVTCRTCSQLRTEGLCLAAARGELRGCAKHYRPLPDRRQRCEGYQPKPGLDSGPNGRERWPFLLD